LPKGQETLKRLIEQHVRTLIHVRNVTSENKYAFEIAGPDGQLVNPPEPLSDCRPLRGPCAEASDNFNQ